MVRLVFGVGLSAALIGLLGLTVVLLTQGLDRAATWASVLGTGLTLAGALVSVVMWWLRRHAAVERPAPLEQVAHAAQELRVAVWEQWRQEAEARSLGDPDPMPVRWRLSNPDVMDHEEHIAAMPLRLSGRSDRIPALAGQFLRLQRRRLVIIGGAGSGKTTLAVQLLLHLIEGWQPGDQVPVLLSLSSWDPALQPRVQNWLATQLAQTYPALQVFGRDTAQHLADRGQVLPVLDGLDEMPAERSGEVIKALNASLLPDTGVILTSRTAEYLQAVQTGDVLTAAAVIEPEPLTPGEAAAYLANRLPRRPSGSWQAVLTALRDGTAGPLAEVVANPLGLWLLSTVHIDGRRDPGPLLEPGRYPDGAALQRQLLDALIPAVIRSRPPAPEGQVPLRPKRQHDPDQFRRWLTFIACHIDQLRTADLAWWQLVAAIPRATRGVSVGLAVGLLFGAAGAIGVADVVDRTYPLKGYLLLSLVFGVTTGLSYGLSKNPEPLRAEMQFRATLGSFLRRFGFGFAVGVAFGLGVGFPYEWVPVAGLAFGFSLAAPVWLDVPTRRKAFSPGTVLRQDRAAALLFGLILALPFGLAGGLVVGLRSGLAFGVVSGIQAMAIGALVGGIAGGVLGGRAYGRVGGGMFALSGVIVGGLVFDPIDTSPHPVLGPAYGLIFGFAVGCVGVLSRAWGVYTASRLWLCLLGRLPYRLTSFLDDAYRLGLMRIVGSVYQFRHAALQNHLAAPDQTTPPVTPVAEHARRPR